MNQKTKRIRFLTDENGRDFFEQVVIYMEQKYGADALSGQAAMTDAWKRQEKNAGDCQEIESEKSQELESLLTEESAHLPTEDNPIDYVAGLKQRSILDLVMPEKKAVSEKKLELSDVVSKRELNQGYGDFSDVEKADSALSALWFGEYLMGHFSSAVDEEPKGALDYELEYIYAGKESDRENLEAVVKKLILMRFAADYLYVKNSADKRASAEALALTLCSLLAVPQIEQAVAQMILLSWAYGEAVMDLRTLLNGGKIPLIKNDESWQLSLSGLMQLGEGKDMDDGKDNASGLEYEEYLRILLFLGKTNHLKLRTMDLVEKNLQTVYGQTCFRLDACISKMETESTCQFRRGIQYRFQTYYGYR